jgi:HTH-type transcriptional regulator/antitoxin HigA
MDIKPIRTNEDYQSALEEIDRLFDALPDTPEGDRLEVLVTLVEAYESRRYPTSLPDPIEAIEYHLESRGLSRRDLEPYIGNRARVSEILNRKRPLSLRMIRNLEKGLGIPAEILVQRYDVQPYDHVARELEEQEERVVSLPRESTPPHTRDDKAYYWIPSRVAGQSIQYFDLNSRGASTRHH